MFRGRVFGGTLDAWHLSCEYGPQAATSSSKLPTPEALARMELDWTSNEADTQVCALCGRMYTLALHARAHSLTRATTRTQPHSGV
jgi:hypothetical protein